MTLTFDEALDEVLAALRAGYDFEQAVAGFPEHAPALQADARVVRTLSRLPDAVPEARPAAREAASRRLHAQLQSQRQVTRSGSVRPSAPRLALASAVAAVAAVILLFVLTANDAAIEAATIEGVVVDNAGGTLTVQTLDALELVTVPDGASVSDAAGTAIGLDSIAAGQVVSVEVERRADRTVAREVRRSAESLGDWCAGAAERCRALSDRLDRAQNVCDTRTCDVADDRLDALQDAAQATARLETLKQDCRAGTAVACRDLLAFCRQQAALCRLTAAEPDRLPDAVVRLLQLQQRCAAGDDAACGQLAGVCAEHPAFCPGDAPMAPLAPTLPPLPRQPLAPTIAPDPTRPPAFFPTVTPSVDRSGNRPAVTPPPTTTTISQTSDSVPEPSVTLVPDVRPEATRTTGTADAGASPEPEPTQPADASGADARPDVR